MDKQSTIENQPQTTQNTTFDVNQDDEFEQTNTNIEKVSITAENVPDVISEAKLKSVKTVQSPTLDVSRTVDVTTNASVITKSVLPISVMPIKTAEYSPSTITKTCHVSYRRRLSKDPKTAVSKTCIKTISEMRKPSKWRKKLPPLPPVEEDLINNFDLAEGSTPVLQTPTEYTALSTTEQYPKVTRKKISRRPFVAKWIIISVAISFSLYQFGCALGILPTLSQILFENEMRHQSVEDIVKNFHHQIENSIRTVKWTDELNYHHKPKPGSICPIIYVGEWTEWSSTDEFLQGKTIRSRQQHVLDPSPHDLDCPPNVHVLNKAKN